MHTKVFVDVFTWIAATAHHGYIPFEGIYRHTYALAREFEPVVCVNQAESTPEFGRALRRVSDFIKKPIEEFRSAQEVLFRKPNVWLSIALDSPSPVLPELADKVWRVAVLHDVLAYHGHFGAGNVKTFHFGAQHNDMLLPVTTASLREYEELALPYNHIHEFVPYGCFHMLPELPPPSARTEGLALSLGTVYPRKRFAQTVRYSQRQLYQQHLHIGRFAQSDNDQLWRSMLASGYLLHPGYRDDMKIAQAYCSAEAFFMLSSDEGFSMTPLEAVLYGVPYLYLSPIPAHVEIYSDVNAHWVHDMTEGFGSKPLPVSMRQRQELYRRWSFDRVIAPFKKFLA